MSPIAAGMPLPPLLATALEDHGLGGVPAMIMVVKDGCVACEDALPLLNASLHAGWKARPLPVLVVAQEDAATTKSLQQSLAPHLPAQADDAPHALSTALGVQVTPTFLWADQGTVNDVGDAFDPDALHRMLQDMAAAGGRPPFHLFPDGQPRPRFRPG